MKLKYFFILALVIFMMPVGRAFAHRVIIFAWVEDGMIHTQSSFGSKRKARDCAITVTDDQGRIVHNGRTDTDGNHSFAIPRPIDSDLVLTLEAGTGHRAQWTIDKRELTATLSAGDTQAAMEEKETLEKSPSILKIFTGIALIFLLAFAVKRLNRKISGND